MFGLNNRDIHTIESIGLRYPSVKLVSIFGSRAKGNFNEGSDIDLAVMNSGVTDIDLLRIKSDLEESSIPYFVDIINYPLLKHKELRSHIDRVGKLFYSIQTELLPNPEIKYGSS